MSGMQSQVVGPISSQVTLNAAGYGFVRFQAVGQNVQVTNMSSRCSTTVLEATGTVYKGQIGVPYRLSGTFTASSGDNNTDTIQLNDGEALFFEFTGGDVGAIGTVTISGTASVGSGGFRAMG
jgi:hypothetical protein